MANTNNKLFLVDLLNRNLKTRDLQERKSLLRDTLKLAQLCPPAVTYCSLCRQLADVCFKTGDYDEGIYHLVESHAVVIRYRALMKYHKTVRTNPDDKTVFQKKDLHLDIENGYSNLLKIIKEMPKEWTVVQISCASDVTWRFGGPKLNTWTPTLHIVRFECGTKPENKPLHLKLIPPPEADHFVILEEIRTMMKRNTTNDLMPDRVKFWKRRSEVDTLLMNIIEFINLYWFVSLSPFLAGQLRDDKLRKKIRSQVDKIISKMNDSSSSPLSQENHCLVVKTAENLDCLSDSVVPSIIARAINKQQGSQTVKRICKEFDLLKKEFSSKLSCVERDPVLLIVDEKLESIPFEQLEILKNNPVTRVPSIHALNGLFQVHKNSIKSGLKMVDSNSGYYVINPGNDLKSMESRMATYMIPRVPRWNGIVGQVLSQEEWKNVIVNKDIFVYMGHGGGGQYWNFEKIEGGIRSVSIAFGCQSAGYKMMIHGVEEDASLQEYLASACPCLVGMLWSVTDKDTDAASQAIMDAWLPRYSTEMEPAKESSNEKRTRRKVANVAHESAKSTVVTNKVLPPEQPELARAIIQARNAPKMLITKAGLIMRGLPVCIK